MVSVEVATRAKIKAKEAAKVLKNIKTLIVDGVGVQKCAIFVT